jgi:pilus assembly protein CpaF
MYQIIIKLPDKPHTNGKLSPGVYRIGKSPASHIQLDRAEVSSRHAVLHVKEHELGIVDAGSTNGTYVDGKRIDADKMVNFNPGATLTIGTDVTITINEIGGGESRVQKPSDVEQNAPSGDSPVVRQGADKEERLLMLSGIKAEYRKVAQGIKVRVHEELLKRINLKNLTLSGADREEVQGQARSTVDAIMREVKSDIPSGINVEALQKEIVDEAVGLGPIETLLQDDDVTEIMVNGCDNIYIEKAGALYRTDLCYGSDDQVLTAIERIVAPLGRRIDESQPLVDARLPDGSRVNSIIPPLAIDGPSLTIRKFGKRSMTMRDLISYTSITAEMAAFLELCVKLRKNILISGGTGSGKTTLLNIVSNYVPNDERIVTIEDAAELRLNQPHLVRLESRPPNIEGRGQIAIRDLVRNSLRMRPDRIVIGECRGGEALDMLQAMNTGHDGSLTTIHANSPRDAMARLETLVLMAGFDLPLRAIREQIASAISIVVQIGRMKDGTRKVQAISEITGMEGEVITAQDLFTFEQRGLDENGRVTGKHKSCNIVPTFVEEIQISGIPFDFSIFSENEESE